MILVALFVTGVVFNLWIEMTPELSSLVLAESEAKRAKMMSLINEMTESVDKWSVVVNTKIADSSLSLPEAQQMYFDLMSSLKKVSDVTDTMLLSRPVSFSEAIYIGKRISKLRIHLRCLLKAVASTQPDFFVYEYEVDSAACEENNFLNKGALAAIGQSQPSFSHRSAFQV